MIAPNSSSPAQGLYDAGRASPTDEEVRAALTRVIAHPEFGASKRRVAFLKYIVEETLAGRARELKGYTIATAVFGRDESFDSRTDPVVRLEARRMRHDLDSFYIGPGAADPVRISIPKGGYTPLFEARYDAPAQHPSTPVSDGSAPGAADVDSLPGPAGPAPGLQARPAHRPRRLLAALGGAAAVLAVVLAVLWFPRGDTAPADPLAQRGYPRVVIMPFTAIGSSEDLRALSAGLGTELGHFLRQFEGLRLYEPFDGADPGPTMDKLRGEPGALYSIHGQLYAEGTQVRVNATLKNLRSGEVVWSDRYDVALMPGALMEMRDRLAGQIATALGQPYGAIAEDIVRHDASADAASLESYLCILRAYEYRRRFSGAAYGPTLACLEAAVARDPDYADAWAMLGWLHLDAGRYGFPGAAPVETEYALALEAARRALTLAPDGELALRALSSIQHYLRHFDESERLARRAVELNPYDPAALAELGWRLAVRGNFDEGVPLLHEAIDRSVEPPAWYFHLLAIDHLMKGDYAAMRGEAERAALSDYPIGQALRAIAAAGLGDRETARAALSRIPPDWDTEAFLWRHGATEQIVAVLVQGLAAARQLAGDPARP